MSIAFVGGMAFMSLWPSAAEATDWRRGARTGLCRDTEIREGPGTQYRVHTRVPENDWLVDITDGPRSANGQQWWDVSRRRLDGGGTGWVSREQSEGSCNSSAPPAPPLPPVPQPSPWSVALEASATSVPGGGSVTLTARASQDVGPTPYYIVIAAAGGSRVGSCGQGTTCSFRVSASGGTARTYQAVIGDSSGGRVQTTSNQVTVTWTGGGGDPPAPPLPPVPQPSPWLVSLEASATSVPGDGTVTLTARANRNVGPTPYYIVILAGNSPRTFCGNGDACSMNVSANSGASNSYRAVIGNSSGGNIQATSNPVTVNWTGGGGGGGAPYVILDPGHGGADAGAPALQTAQNCGIALDLKEKDRTMDISRRVRDILVERSVRVRLTHEDANTTMSLTARTDFINNERPNLAVSIHANSVAVTAPATSPEQCGSGVEAWYSSVGPGGRPNPNLESSRQLAQRMATAINQNFGLRLRRSGGIADGNLQLVRAPEVPSALIETAFISNPNEAALLRDRPGEFAQAIARAILEHLGIR